MADKTDYLSAFRATAAGANVNAANGVPQGAAISGFNSGPPNGVDPSLAMHDPQQVQDLDAQRKQQEYLNNPAIASFATTSPAHVAATAPDWEHLDTASKIASDFTDPFKGFKMNPDLGKLKEAVLGAFNPDPNVRAQSERIFRDESANIIPPDIRAAMGVFAGAGNLLGRVVGPGYTAFENKLGQVTGANPSGIVPNAQQEQTRNRFIGNALLAFVPIGGGAKSVGAELGGAERAAGRGGTAPPDVGGGAPFLHPETGAPAFTQHGFVADAEGMPAAFATKGEAAKFVFQNLGDLPGEFKPFNDQNTGQWGVVRTEGSARNYNPTEAAQESADNVAGMQEAVAKTQFHSQAPGLTEEFLSHTDVAGESAWVDPHAILDARREGHDPFPNHDAEIDSAVASGRELEVPMETYIADTAGKPYEEALRNATRFGDNRASLNEAGQLPKQPAGFDLGEQAGAFVVKPNTMDLNAVANMLPTAEQFGGRYAVGRANTAFQFPTTAARDSFIAAVSKDGLAPTFEQSVGPAVDRRATPRTPESEAEYASKVSVRDAEASTQGNYELATVDTPHGAAYIVKPTEGGTEHLLEAAQRNGGRYAMGRANSAFQFRTPEARAAFLREVEGPKEIPADIEPEFREPLRELAAAVDAAVEEVFKENGLDTLFEEPKAAGLTKRQFAKYGERIEEAKAALTDRILQRTYNQIRRERTPEWKEHVAQLQAEVEKELAEVPVLRAYSQLTRGKGVLGEPLEQPFRLLADDDLSKFGKDLGLPASMFRKKEGLSADQLAAELGFESGAGMIRELTELHAVVGERSFAEFMRDTTKALAEGRARAELGYDVSPEGLMEAAREEATLPEIEHFFGSVIRDLQAIVGGRPITVDDVRAQATGQFDALPVKQASNPKVFERGIKRTGEQALRALEKEDYGAALTFRVQQLLNFQQLKMSWKFRKDLARDQKKLKRWGKAEVIPGVDPLVSAIIQDSVAEAGYAGGRDPAELQRALFAAKEAGRISTMPEAVNAANDQGYGLTEAPIVGDNAATPTSWRAMMDMLTGVAKFGKELHEVTVGAKQWEIVGLANEVQANAEAIGRRYTPDQLLAMRDTMFGRFKGQVKSLLVNNIRPEVPLYWLDGEAQGPLMRSVVNPLMAGKYTETDLINGWIKAMREAGSSEYLAKTDKGIDAPDHMRVDTAMGPAHILRTEGQYRTALMYLGSETARTKLLEGFGWGEEQEDWLLARATAEDKAYIKAFWDQNEKLFNLADEMYRRVRGYGLVKDEPRTVTFPDGSTLPGGHIHITYDPTLKVLRQIEEVPGEDILRAAPQASRENPLDDDHPIRALPSAFYGLERTKFVGPVNLDPRALAGGIAEVIHDISFREALQAAQKVLFDPRVQEAMMSVLGPTYRTQMSPWLHYIAKDRVLFNPATQAAAQIIRNLSSNFVFAKVGFNLSSTIKHSSIGLMHMIREAGDPAVFAKAGQDLLTDHDHWAGFIDQMSGEVRGLMWNIDTNLQEALARDALTGGRLHDARQLGFYLFAVSKRLEAQVTWLATYRREMADHGNTEKAVASGNKAVRDTQGASASVDLPTFFRKGDDFAHEIMRNTLGLLMGFRNTVPNRLWTAGRLGGQAMQGKGGGGKAASIYLTYVLGAAAILALYEVYARGGGDPRKSKGDNFAEAFGWGISEQTIGSFMGLNKLEQMAHYGSDSDFSRLSADGKRLMEGHPWGAHEWGDVAKVIAGATGAIPDSAIHLMSAIKDTATGDINNPITFVQRGLLGRQGNEGGSGTPRRAARAKRASRPARGGGHK